MTGRIRVPVIWRIRIPVVRRPALFQHGSHINVPGRCRRVIDVGVLDLLERTVKHWIRGPDQPIVRRPWRWSGAYTYERRFDRLIDVMGFNRLAGRGVDDIVVRSEERRV